MTVFLTMCFFLNIIILWKSQSAREIFAVIIEINEIIINAINVYFARCCINEYVANAGMSKWFWLKSKFYEQRKYATYLDESVYLSRVKTSFLREIINCDLAIIIIIQSRFSFVGIRKRLVEINRSCIVFALLHLFYDNIIKRNNNFNHCAKVFSCN